MNETATLTEVAPAAERIIASHLRVGDRVFGTVGRVNADGDVEVPTYALTKVRRHGAWIHTRREDGVEDRFHDTETVTVVKAGGWGA